MRYVNPTTTGLFATPYLEKYGAIPLFAAINRILSNNKNKQNIL
jgi:hypothetical protein